MATKPLTTEAIALTEKKMDMSLDDIIKMSKTNVGKTKKQRISNKSRKPINGKQDRVLNTRQYLDSRSTLRQGVLAQKRSNFQGNSFPLVSNAAQKEAAVAPFRNGAYDHSRAANWNRSRAAGLMRRQGNASIGTNAHKQRRQQPQPSQKGGKVQHQKPKTLDSLFANMKEQRMRVFPRTNNGAAVRGVFSQPRHPWLRGRFGNYRS